MNRDSNGISRWVLGFALAVVAQVAWADAGQVLFTVGRVEIARTYGVVVAFRGMPVQVGDRINVGSASRAQIRMKDGALLSLRPDSSIVIEDFSFADVPPAAALASSATPPTVLGSQRRSILRLLRGGLRTISGLVGKARADRYEFRTPVATIGIRGTTWSGTYCSGDCGATQDGLYVGVSDGAVSVSNDGGELLLADNEYGYVNNAGQAPEQLIEPPDVLNDDIEGDAGEDTEEGEPADGGGGVSGNPPYGPSDGSGSNLEYQEPEVPDQPAPNAVRLVAHATGPMQTASTFTGAGVNNIPPMVLDGSGALVAFRGNTPSGVADHGIGTAANADLGFAPDTALRWGRWAGGQAQVGQSALDLAHQSLHWIISAEGTSVPAMPITGTASYRLVGNTNPTDNFGHVGFLGSASLSANFTDRTVTNSLGLGINNQIWAATGSGNLIVVNGVVSPLFAGNYTTVIVNDVTAGNNGSFTGFFTSPGSAGVPAGAGLSYSLNSGGVTVSGVAAFGKPGQGQ